MVKAVELTEKNAYFKVWDGRENVALNRVVRSFNFKCFLELGPQTAHDSGLHGLHRKKKFGNPREAHLGQVKGNTEELGFYRRYGNQSAKIAAAYFASAWLDPNNHDDHNHNSPFLRGGHGTSLAVQRYVLRDGYSYEITVWYEADGIYTSFHCYPNDNGGKPPNNHWLYPLC